MPAIKSGSRVQIQELDSKTGHNGEIGTVICVTGDGVIYVHVGSDKGAVQLDEVNPV